MSKEIPRISESEKELVNIIGKLPETSPKELLSYTKYKWVSTVVRKLDHLRDQDIIWGPYYQIDYGKLCRNPLRVLVCIVESSLDYETVISYLMLIEPLKWIYPVLSPYKKLLHVGFISSNDTEMVMFLQMLRENSIITDYVARICNSKWILENPNFFGDHNAPLDNLLDQCELPDMSLGCHDTEWSECDISILPYLQVGYEGTKLIEIMKAERKLHKKWTYGQIKYSHRKMVNSGLIEKRYSISPYARNECAHFVLFLRTGNISLTRRILYNFAKGERVYKEYTLCDDWGMLTCQSHPRFLTDLMHKLDQIDEIEEKELYQLRSYPGKYFFKQSFENKYFDFENQTLQYPHEVYREKIKERMASQ